MEFLGGEERRAEAEFDQVGAAATSLHGLLVLWCCCCLVLVCCLWWGGGEGSMSVKSSGTLLKRGRGMQAKG